MSTTIAAAQRLGREEALIKVNDLKRKMQRADLIATLNQPDFWEKQARSANTATPPKWSTWRGDTSFSSTDTLMDVYVRAFVEEAKRSVTDLRDNDLPDTKPNPKE